MRNLLLVVHCGQVEGGQTSCVVWDWRDIVRSRLLGQDVEHKFDFSDFTGVVLFPWDGEMEIEGMAAGYVRNAVETVLGCLQHAFLLPGKVVIILMPVCLSVFWRDLVGRFGLTAGEPHGVGGKRLLTSDSRLRRWLTAAYKTCFVSPVEAGKVARSQWWAGYSVPGCHYAGYIDFECEGGLRRVAVLPVKEHFQREDISLFAALVREWAEEIAPIIVVLKGKRIDKKEDDKMAAKTLASGMKIEDQPPLCPFKVSLRTGDPKKPGTRKRRRWGLLLAALRECYEKHGTEVPFGRLISALGRREWVRPDSVGMRMIITDLQELNEFFESDYKVALIKAWILKDPLILVEKKEAIRRLIDGVSFDLDRAALSLVRIEHIV